MEIKISKNLKILSIKNPNFCKYRNNNSNNSNFGNYIGTESDENGSAIQKKFEVCGRSY